MSSSADGPRAPGADDADAIAAVLAGSRPLDAREVRSWFANPTFDPTNDFRVFERDGEIVGCADVHRAVDRLSVDWIADDAAAGHALLDWAEERAHAEGIGRLVAWAWPGSDVSESLVESRGFTPLRSSLEMQAPLDATPEPAWPDGVSIRTIRSGEERERLPADAVRRAALWHERKRLDVWFAAEADGSLVAVALCEAERTGTPGLGWLETLAVRRSWRRRGLGRALLLHSFRELARLGCTTAGLSVDAENPTGAVRLYESVGMRPVSRRVLYEKRLSGASAL